MAKIGIQLYTVRDELEKDYEGTVRKMAALGYEGVEFPGGVMNAIRPERLRALLEEEKLLLCGLVFEARELEDDMDRVLAYCAACGCKSAVVPCVPHGNDRNREDFERYGDSMIRWGEALGAAGIELLHHVHGNEFVDFGGETGWDILWAKLEKTRVRLEIDVYWVEHAGEDSLAFFRRYGAYSPSVHLKDYENRETMRDTEVGAGCIPIPEIIKEALRFDAKWLIVEQEQFSIPSVQSATVSLANIRIILSA